MGTDTLIAFTHHTWSPWRGCEHASLHDGTAHPGCTHCYAETMSAPNPAVLGEWGPGSHRAIGADKYWRLPYGWNKAAKEAGERRRVLPSLMDPFEQRDDLIDSRAKMFDIIAECQHLDFLLFTKRPQNIISLWPTKLSFLPNIWLLYSASDQTSLASGLPSLLSCAHLSPILGVSLEPLVGPIDLTHVGYPNYSDTSINCLEAANDGTDQNHRSSGDGRIAWVIVGGESGSHARPCDCEWIRSIKTQCQTAGVPCFVKQLGAYASIAAQDVDVPPRLALKHPKGGDPTEWPLELRVQEIPRMGIPLP